MPIIETKNLEYVYGVDTGFEKPALTNVNISIEKGEFIGLIGHTGSGKSTLIQQLNGLLKPTSGKVILEGKDIWEQPKKIREVRFKVGMVFQYPEYQLFEENVYKDIAFGPSNMGLNEAKIKSRVLEAARFVGLSENLLFKSPFDLSGGEKRRAAIAGIIAMDPEILILDEPTAGLDPLGKKSLIKQIMDYHKERKNTIIFVSHSMEDIAKVADRVLVMANGTVKMFDTPENIFAKADYLNKIGLRLPQITRIMKKLKDKGYAVNDNVLTVQQGVEQILRLLRGESISNG